MRIPRLLTILAAAAALSVILGVGWLVSRPRGPVVRDAAVSPDAISPNADGVDDITRVDYRLVRPAIVDIYFEAQDGTRHYFRRDAQRGKGEYSVLFGGVVDGYLLNGEELNSIVDARLMPDGDYQWVIEARELGVPGATPDVLRGPFVVENGDPVLPDMQTFSISPPHFTPNQDGFADRVAINIYLPKPADLQVYLINPAGVRYFVPESADARKPGEAGMHTFDYEGGVDQGAPPPPNGDYTIVALAEDEEGQRTRVEGTLTIADGGVPLAEIVGQPIGDTVTYSAETLHLGDTLTFELTVENYGDAPIRTTGPASGTIYKQSERASTLGFYEESGAWRVGIDCDTCLSDYPWRWALGDYSELTVVEVDGTTQYYLLPGQRVIVTGGIILEEAIASRNPQYFWAGLIHEDVGITVFNNRVDPHLIEIIVP